jgi:hypothetical protein
MPIGRVVHLGHDRPRQHGCLDIDRGRRKRQPPQEVRMHAQAIESRVTPVGLALRALIVAATLVTAYIHSTLGGLLFTLNATGYLVAAVAMVIPLGIAIRFRGVVRLGLIAYAVTTIVGWALMGPRYTTAYVAKADELVLIALLAVDFLRADGNPVAYVKAVVAEALAVVGLRPAGAASRA